MHILTKIEPVYGRVSLDGGVPDMRLMMNRGLHKRDKYGDCDGYTDFIIDGRVVKVMKFIPRRNELYIQSSNINTDGLVDWLVEHSLIGSTRMTYVLGKMSMDFGRMTMAGPYIALSFKTLKDAALFRLFFG